MRVRHGPRTDGAAHLADDKGTIHADGFTGFNGLFGNGLAGEQACMVHVRRKFVDVFERHGSAIARETIERIAGLYAVEKEARYRPPDERVALPPRPTTNLVLSEGSRLVVGRGGRAREAENGRSQ